MFGSDEAQWVIATLHVCRHSNMWHLEELLLKVPRGERRAAVELAIGRKVPENVWNRRGAQGGRHAPRFRHSDMRHLGELMLRVPRGARHPLCCVASFQGTAFHMLGREDAGGRVDMPVESPSLASSHSCKQRIRQRPRGPAALHSRHSSVAYTPRFATTSQACTMQESTMRW